MVDQDTTVVGTDVNQTLTNKTITNSNNQVAVNILRYGSTNYSLTTAPVSGQIFTFDTLNNLTWSYPPISIAYLSPSGASNATTNIKLLCDRRACASTNGIATFYIMNDGTINGTSIFTNLTTAYITA